MTALFQLSLQTIIMIKSLITSKTNNYLCKLIKNSFAYPKQSLKPQKEGQDKKAYQILLTNNMENRIKFPSFEILRTLRARGITKIMASNHNIFQTDQILEAHIECLYALIHRVQPSIQAISMFAERIYQEIDHLREVQISVPSLTNLLKPTIITKIVKITHAIDGFYNQAFRTLISALVIKLLQKSIINEKNHIIQSHKLSQQFDLMRKGLKPIVDQQGKILGSQDLNSWHLKKLKEINQTNRYLNEIDYWNGFQFVLNMEYYTEEFLKQNVSLLEKSFEKDIRNYSINELTIKIKCIVELHKFKNHKQVGEKGLKSLYYSYNKSIQQYFKLLSTQANLFQIINSDQSIIQTQLLTSFLTPEHYQRAKKVYLQVFKAALNVSSNGTLLIDIKRLKGIFQLILILYNHQDTKQIHQILTQLQRVMIMYPLEKFDRLEAHCFVCQKFGFKSDFFAQKFFDHLIFQKQKLQRNRGHLHHIHQLTREIFLAKKFLIFSKIAIKPNKQQFQTASKLSSSLFDPNVWYCLTEGDFSSELFLTSSTFSHHIYFLRTGIQNITAGSTERRKIQGMKARLNLRNLSKQHSQVTLELKSLSNKFSLKIDHLSNWRNNPHARMRTLLELANHNYEYLKRSNPQEANNFIQQFISKTLGVTIFYNTLKQRFAYPDVLKNFIELMEKAIPKSLPIQNRDLQAIKRLYHSHLSKIMKDTQKPMFSYYYQEHLDLIELNRVVIPFNQEVYGLSNIGQCAAQSLLYQAMKRFEKQKEHLRMQIETYLKFNKIGDVQISTNYLEIPHLADVKVKINQENFIILYRSYEGEPNHFLNYKQSEMQRESQIYWKKKGFIVYIVKGQKDIENFTKKITKLSVSIQK